MIWSRVLDDWANGKPQGYPEGIMSAFIWRTNAVYPDENQIFNEEFVVRPSLKRPQNYDDFQNQFLTHTGSVIVFPNLSEDTILVVPRPVPNKNFSTLKTFIDTASYSLQQTFWRTVSKTVREELETHGKVYVSVHGGDVPYLHVRVSRYPKYYENSRLSYT